MKKILDVIINDIRDMEKVVTDIRDNTTTPLEIELAALKAGSVHKQLMLLARNFSNHSSDSTPEEIDLIQVPASSSGLSDSEQSQAETILKQDENPITENTNEDQTQEFSTFDHSYSIDLVDEKNEETSSDISKNEIVDSIENSSSTENDTPSEEVEPEVKNEFPAPSENPGNKYIISDLNEINEQEVSDIEITKETEIKSESLIEDEVTEDVVSEKENDPEEKTTSLIDHLFADDSEHHFETKEIEITSPAKEKEQEEPSIIEEVTSDAETAVIKEEETSNDNTVLPETQPEDVSKISSNSSFDNNNQETTTKEPISTVLGEKFVPKVKSINDIFSSKVKTEKNPFENAPVNNLKTSININDRFLFIKDLFNGNQVEYSEAIEKLDSCTDIREAVSYLKARYRWQQGEASQKFLELIKQRFSN